MQGSLWRRGCLLAVVGTGLMSTASYACTLDTGVVDEVSLNAAIDCFNNGLPGPGNHTIFIDRTIFLSSGLNPISRSDGGASPDSLTIQSGVSRGIVGTGDAPPSNAFTNNITISGTNPVILDNLIISAAHASAVRVTSNSSVENDVTLSNLLILDSRHYGLNVSGDNARVALNFSSISSSQRDGIRVAGDGGSVSSSFSLVLSNSNVSSNAGAGINVLQNGAVEVLDNSTVSSNGGSGVLVGGLRFDEDGNSTTERGAVRFVNSEATNNGESGLKIGRATSPSSSIIRSLIERNVDIGVEVTELANVTIQDSTIANHENVAGVVSNNATLLIQNSTISSNFERLNYNGSGEITVANSTIAFNDNDGISANGTRPANIFSSLVVGNGFVNFGGNCSFAPLVDSDTGFPKVVDVNNSNYSDVGSEPDPEADFSTDSCGFFESRENGLLGELQDNGCEDLWKVIGRCLPTHELLTGSPAIANSVCTGFPGLDDGGLPPIPMIEAVTTDQGGRSRISQCSVGAYEPPALVSKVITSNRWYQISLPLDPGSLSTVQDVIGTALPVDDYLTTWAMFEWVLDPTNPMADDYRRLSPTDEMDPRKGYWIQQITGESVTLTMPVGSSLNIPTPSSACPSNTGCVDVPLMGAPNVTNRVNFTGYPATRSLPLSDTRIVNRSTSNMACAVGCTPDEARSLNVMVNFAFNYNGVIEDYTQYKTVPDPTQRPVANVIKPWDGLWMSTLPAGDEAVDWLIPLP